MDGCQSAPVTRGQRAPQVAAGGDAELREHLVQVPLDRAGAEEEPGPGGTITSASSRPIFLRSLLP